MARIQQFVKTVFPLVSLVCLALILSACILPATQTPAEGEAAAEQAASSEMAEETIVLQATVRDYTLQGDSPWVTAAEEMKRRHPNVEIELEGMGYDEQRQKTLIAVGAGEGPDIVQVDTIWLGEFADGDIIIDLSEYYANWEGREDIPESFLESSQWEGKYYGVWLNSDVRFLVWEKEALRAAGLDPEVAPQTWEELIANAQQAQNPPETWGFAFPAFSTDHTADRWYPFLWQSGGDILTEDFSQAAFNSEAGVQALQFLSDLINVHEVTPPDILTISNSDLTTAIDQGRYVYAIRVGPGANADRFQGDPELFQELRGVGHLPIPAGGEQATGSGGWLLGITRDSEHPDLAWEYITLVTDPDNAAPFWKANGMVPTRTSALGNIEEYEASFPYFELVAEAVQFTHFRPAIPEYPELSTHIVQAIQRTLAQEATAQEALDEAAAAVNELLSGGE